MDLIIFMVYQVSSVKRIKTQEDVLLPFDDAKVLQMYKLKK